MWCSSVNFFNFHTCEHTIPRARTLSFRPRPASTARCRHRLLLELQRSLITFDPPAFVLDPQTRPRAPLSPPSVQAGSWPFHLSPAYTAPPVRSASHCNTCALNPRLFVAAPTTDFLTAASTIDTLGVGITAAAGTELALQSPSRTPLQCALPRTSRNCLLAKEWAISAPAAVLGRGSHLSGSLSGIRPPSPVTRRRLGSPLHYQPADRAASQSQLLATVSRGYRPPGADRRSITEPFAVPFCSRACMA